MFLCNLAFPFAHLQDAHRLYKQKLEEVTKLQISCSGAISRQKKKLKELTASLEEWVLISVLLSSSDAWIQVLNPCIKYLHKNDNNFSLMKKLKSKTGSTITNE